MNRELVIAATPIFESMGWSQVHLKRTSAAWQLSRSVCLLRVSLDDSRQHAGSVLQFSANVILDVWRHDLAVEDDLPLPFFRVAGGTAKRSGFSEDYSYDGARYFEEGPDLGAYLENELPVLEQRYLNFASLLSIVGFTQSNAEYINRAAPQSIAVAGQLLIAMGRANEGKELLDAYARLPFNSEICGRLIKRLEDIAAA